MLGGLWYGPLFGAMWMADNEHKTEDLGRGLGPALAYGGTFVLGLISATLFAVIVGSRPSLGYTVGLGAATGTRYLFERRPLRLFLFNAGYHTPRIALIGLTFGLIG